MAGNLKIGQIFQKRYLLLAELGRGGAGLVFHAQQVDVDRDVALKTLRDEKKADAETVGRFFREFRTLSGLSHPHIMTVYGVALDDDDSPYAICEFVRGVSLRKTLRDEGAMPWQRAVRILIQVCQASKYAHQKGVIHRDLKPDNIMLDLQGTPDFVKILDFGLSKSFVDIGPEHGPKLTWTGQLIGSPQYMSPEQTMNKADCRSDIYSSGCLLFELLCGEQLFTADVAIAIILKQCNEDPHPRFASIPGSMPEKLFSILSKTLEKDPDHRFQTMEQLEEELQSLLAVNGIFMTGAEWQKIAARIDERKKNARISLIWGALAILLINCVLFASVQSDWSLNLNKSANTFLAPISSSAHSVEQKDRQTVRRLSSEINQLESLKNYSAAFPKYELLINTMERTEHVRKIRCGVLAKALNCARALLDSGAAEGKKIAPANARLAIDLAICAEKCATDENKFSLFILASTVKLQSLEDLGDLKGMAENCLYIVEQADKIWGKASRHAVQARTSVLVFYCRAGDYAKASRVLKEAKIIAEKASTKLEDRIALNQSEISILAKRGLNAEAAKQLSACSKQIVDSADDAGGLRPAVMERLLLNYFDLNDLKGFEAAFARDRTNHPGLYRSSPDLTGRIFSELARRYAETGQINEAARIYKLEMESYPDSEVNSRLRRNCLVNLEKISRSRSEIRQMQIYRDQILAIDKLQKNQRVK